jgi:hypothetical protein
MNRIYYQVRTHLGEGLRSFKLAVNSEDEENLFHTTFPPATNMSCAR